MAAWFWMLQGAALMSATFWLCDSFIGLRQRQHAAKTAKQYTPLPEPCTASISVRQTGRTFEVTVSQTLRGLTAEQTLDALQAFDEVNPGKELEVVRVSAWVLRCKQETEV